MSCIQHDLKLTSSTCSMDMYRLDCCEQALENIKSPLPLALQRSTMTTPTSPAFCPSRCWGMPTMILPYMQPRVSAF